jgi:hypothetical protein
VNYSAAGAFNFLRKFFICNKPTTAVITEAAQEITAQILDECNPHELISNKLDTNTKINSSNFTKAIPLCTNIARSIKIKMKIGANIKTKIVLKISPFDAAPLELVNVVAIAATPNQPIIRAKKISMQ